MEKEQKLQSEADNISTLARLTNYLRKLDPSKSHHASNSPCRALVCMQMCPMFSKYKGNLAFCNSCCNNYHAICALILQDDNQANESWQCFQCAGIDSLDKIVELAQKKLQNYVNHQNVEKNLIEFQRAKMKELESQAEKFEGPRTKALHSALDKLGIDLLAYHSGTFVGNHVHKLLKIDAKLNGPEILTEALEGLGDNRFKYRKLLELLSRIFDLTCRSVFLTDDQVRNHL